MPPDERVPSEAFDGAALDLVAPPEVAPPDTAPLARQTLAYGLSGLLVPLVGMITLPIFARTFSQAQYGVLELATTATTVAIAITDAGLTAAALRGFYDYRDDDEHERRTVLTTGFYATTVLAIVLAGLLALFRRPVSELMFGNSREQTVVLLLCAGIPALNTWRYVSEVMRVRLKAFHYLAMSILATFVTTTLIVVGILALGWRVNGALVAGLVGNWAAAAYGLVFVAGSISGRFSRPELKRMLRYGLPLVPAVLAAWALALIDRIILARLGSVAQVGQYAVANRLASLLLIGLTAFLFALTPFLLATFSEDPEQEKAARARTLTYLTFILSVSGLVLTLFAWEIVKVVAPGFIEAYKAVGPLMLGAVGYGLVSLLTTGFSIARKTGRLAALTLIAAAANIGLNFALIPPYGIVGAAFATTIGYGLLAASYYWAAQRVYWTPYEWEKVLIMLALASALGVVGVLPLGSEAVAIPAKLLALAVFLVGLWLTRAISRAELVELKRFAHGMIPLGLRRSRA
jgi:O-antigen/teichoic acid export membrane protein